MTNSVDPGQTPRPAASDLGLHCLQRPICRNTLGYYGILIELENTHLVMLLSHHFELRSLKIMKISGLNFNHLRTNRECMGTSNAFVRLFRQEAGILPDTIEEKFPVLFLCHLYNMVDIWTTPYDNITKT